MTPTDRAAATQLQAEFHRERVTDRGGCRHMATTRWDCGCAFGCGVCDRNYQCLACGAVLIEQPFRRKALRGLQAFFGYPETP